MARALMIQGTGSNVGKSLLVAGLCRAARLRGLSVAPFKPQNMSNNAAVTGDGGEIGRAQALQALACGLAPHTDMNPLLLKPETETGAQVVVQGRRVASLRARDYAEMKPALMAPVLESFARLRARHDLVLVEGAGSPAEVNLRQGDIANMGFAAAADVPVILAGDIDRGGVIAQIVGTQAVLDAADAARVAGFVVNRFRGDPRLFDDGYAMIGARTGWRGYGVVPWFADAWKLPAEDAQDIAARAGGRGQGAGQGQGGASHRLPAPVADRQFRRSRSANAGTGRAPDDARGGPRAARRYRHRDPARHQIDPRRPGLPARAGMGRRSGRASAARRPYPGHLRRVSDAGAQGRGSTGAGRAGGRHARSGISGCRDDDDAAQGSDRTPRRPCRHRHALSRL
ncbi:hypothetical protein OCGS_0485 [Oceaniovalibus guishaninsula JLT2003]|uniref:Cobyric acid synthase n=1 Tax=Oceaniovalibus guishaninsula JLT2003 TaxID=1231392 RepID=K2I8M3_9RHOB|nr:hypothetical protein OCGS_0485 [Oceaniovalibus guishaninsula JLT2003]